MPINVTVSWMIITKIMYISDEQHTKNHKFTFLCGHDSNIASVDAALGVEDYSLPNSIEKKTPIGSKVVFEKWIDKSGKQYVAINLVYQSTDQLRGLTMLDLSNPPMVFPLHLRDLQANADGLYSFDDVAQRFTEAINAYDNIK